MKSIVYGLAMVWALLLAGCAEVGGDQRAATTPRAADTVPPVLALQGDVKDGDITARIQIDNPLDVTTPGVYTLTYTVRDEAGNIATATRTVTVVHPDVAWFLAQHQDLMEHDFVGKFGVDSHPSGWDTGAYLRAYNGNDLLTGRLDDRSGTVLPGWGTRAYPYGRSGNERYSEMLTNALYAYPLAAFARIVKEDPTLAAEFGADAERYYQMVVTLYAVRRPFVGNHDAPYPDGTNGVYFAFPAHYYDYEDGCDCSGLEAPINWTVIIAEPLVEMYRASLAEGSPNVEYRDTVVQVAHYIWWNMHFETSPHGDTFLTWYYWPADINPDSATRMEDLTHGARLAEFVVSLQLLPIILMARAAYTTMTLPRYTNGWNCKGIHTNRHARQLPSTFEARCTPRAKTRSIISLSLPNLYALAKTESCR